MANRLNATDVLMPGDSLTSENGRYQLIMHTYGNLIEYDVNSGSAIWATNTIAQQVGAIMQQDGNFVIFSTNNFLWDSKTQGNNYLIVENDGKVVIYNELGAVEWNSRTPQSRGAVIKDVARDFGGGRYGTCHAVYEPLTKVLRVTTNIWKNSPFQGFYLVVKARLFRGHARLALVTSQPYSYGVDGTMVPFRAHSKRTHVNASPTSADRIAIALFHNPKNDLIDIARQVIVTVADALQTGKKACEENRDARLLIQRILEAAMIAA